MKKIAAAALLAAAMSAAFAAGPRDFQQPVGQPRHFSGPAGFENQSILTVAQARQAADESVCTLRGRLVSHLRSDKYQFMDDKGDSIIVELDDDYDWSHISRDMPIEIYGEVDRDWMEVKIDVKRAVPIKK